MGAKSPPHFCKYFTLIFYATIFLGARTHFGPTNNARALYPTYDYTHTYYLGTATSTLEYTVHTVSNTMNTPYKLRLQFEPGTAEEFKDCITSARGIDLYVRNVHTVQPNCNTLVFENSKDRMYAMLLLSNDPLYTVHEVD